MKITILTENRTGATHAGLCQSEWGLSLLISYQNNLVLLDTGATDLWWKNAQRMKIDLQQLDAVVFSHRHWDHVGGIRHHKLDNKIPVIGHPDIREKIKPEEFHVIHTDFEPHYSIDPLEFLPGVFFLGQIERVTAFEPGTYKGEAMWDDSALAFRTHKGTVVVSGCSHAGICNICEQAKRVTGQPLLAVVGGFHLTKNEPVQVDATLDYFKKQENLQLFPMHCVDFETMVAFKNAFDMESKNTGDTISL